MLFIDDEVILVEDIKRYLKISQKLPVKYILKNEIKKESYQNFYNPKKIEYDYKLIISSKEQLKTFLDFFKNFPLEENEFIAIRRYNMNLKDVFEVIDEYRNTELVDKIYVEQYDKNEYINFEDYEEIYDFLDYFDSLLPENPTTMDIIINAYDYVKKRKYLKENDKKSLISKQFASSVLTPYIVCAGFVKQFNCILKEYNIPCFEYQFQEINKEEGHDVSMVYIEGMGTYFFDITIDSYKDNLNELENAASYKGFMQPYTYYLDKKFQKDNFSTKLLAKTKELELREKLAIQERNNGKDKRVDLFNEEQFKLLYLLQTLLDVNFELSKHHNFFETVCYKEQFMTSKIYKALQKIQQDFGPEITNPEMFIDMLMSAKRNSILKSNSMYYKKALISRFAEKDIIDLSESMNIVTNKIK